MISYEGIKYIFIGLGFAGGLVIASTVIFIPIKKTIISSITFCFFRITKLASFITEEIRKTFKTIIEKPVEVILLLEGLKVYNHTIQGHLELYGYLGGVILLALIYLIKDKINPSDLTGFLENKLPGSIKRLKDNKNEKKES